jgi:hypothetical protein
MRCGCLEQTPERANQQIKARLKGVEKTLMAGFYVNVSEVCCRNLVLAGLIDELRSVATTPIPASKPTIGLGRQLGTIQGCGFRGT